MSYEPYASTEYYIDVYQGTDVPEDDLMRYLKQASRHIDTLTFNRIVGIGFDNLTPYQQEIIREVCCEQADFEYKNADAIGSVLKGYSINGVSAQYGESWMITVQSGVPIRRDMYTRLSQTGLCCRLAR